MNGLVGLRVQNFFTIGLMILGWFMIWTFGHMAFNSK